MGHCIVIMSDKIVIQRVKKFLSLQIGHICFYNTLLQVMREYKSVPESFIFLIHTIIILYIQ